MKSIPFLYLLGAASKKPGMRSKLTKYCEEKMEITPDQIESFDANVRQRFFARLLIKLAIMTDTTAEYRLQFAQKSVALAETLGMRRASAIGGYVLLCSRLGPSFNNHPEIRQVLSDVRIDANLRVSMLPDLVSAKAWEEIKKSAAEIALATLTEAAVFGDSVISAVEGGQYEVGEMGGLSSDAALLTMNLCKLHDMRIIFRPTDELTLDLLEDGCHPVLGSIKLKAINETDVLLGARAADRAKIWFPKNMKSKAEIAQCYTELRKTQPEQAQKLASRYQLRVVELNKYSGWMQRMIKGGALVLDENGILLNAQTGNAYTCELEFFDILGTSSEHDQLLHNAALAGLHKPPISFYHGDLMHWDCSNNAACARHKQEIIDMHKNLGGLIVFSSEGARRTAALATTRARY